MGETQKGLLGMMTGAPKVSEASPAVGVFGVSDPFTGLAVVDVVEASPSRMDPHPESTVPAGPTLTTRPSESPPVICVVPTNM